MTREEKDFCKRCSIHNSCSFVARKLEPKCERINIFQMGEESMLNKVIEWLHYHIQVDEPKIEYNEDGQPLAESFLAHAKASCMAADEVVKQFKKDFGL